MNFNLFNSITNHSKWRSQCINLVASENRPSKAVLTALTSDMNQRYFFKEFFSTSSGFKYEYHGAKFIEEVYDTTESLAKDLFQATYVNLNMLSGHLSNLNMLLAFCQPGDTIVCTDTNFGGYPGLAPEKLPSYLKINIIYIPQNDLSSTVDLDRLEEILIQHKPKIVMLSSSITLFPFPVKEVSRLCREYNIPFCYDASHPMGLIAGKEFQNPFAEGADFIIGSTHKSFPGPQGGIILGNIDCDKINKSCDFVVVDNIHPGRIAALGIALLEMKHYGSDYAKQIILNAKYLAKYLEKRGINIEFREKDYTESHQFLLKKDFGYYEAFTKKLEEYGIILDNSGRIGVSEITRIGMKEIDMDQIALFITEIFSGNERKSLKNDIKDFSLSFDSIKYGFDDAHF